MPPDEIQNQGNMNRMRYLVIYEENPDDLKFFIVDNPLPDTEFALDILAGAPDFERGDEPYSGRLVVNGNREMTQAEESAFELIFGENGKYKTWTEATAKDLYECAPDYVVTVTFLL